jgi:transposase InsO family protein
MAIGERDEQARFRFPVRDRDRKFIPAFDEVFRLEGIEIIRNPLRAPRAKAHAERWVGSVRGECLDWILIFGRRHLEQVLRVYASHYNEHGPRHSLGQRPPAATPPPLVDRSTSPASGAAIASGQDVSPTRDSRHQHPSTRGDPAGSATVIRRRELLGGLIYEYEAAAA